MTSTTKLYDCSDAVFNCFSSHTKSMIEQRMETLNVLYKSLAKYIKAARYIYEGKDEMLKWFKFPVTANGRKEKVAEEVVMTNKIMNSLRMKL